MAAEDRAQGQARRRGLEPAQRGRLAAVRAGCSLQVPGEASAADDERDQPRRSSSSTAHERQQHGRGALPRPMPWASERPMMASTMHVDDARRSRRRAGTSWSSAAAWA